MSYKDKIICVYKITSPSGKNYIGSSVNYKRRLTQYKGTGAKTQTILYNSFAKHGFDNHVFEIVELCTKENVLERELYYGSLYKVLGEKGLNCKLPKFGEKYQNTRQETIDKMKAWKPSEDTIAKMKAAQTKRAKEQPVSDETKQKLREANLGKKASDETKKKMSLKGKGRVVSEETKERMRAWKRKPVSEEVKKRISEKLKGKPMLEKTREALRIALTGRPCSQKTKENAAKANSKIILDVCTGVYYNSIKEAAFYNNIKNTTLTAMLIGQNKNKTNLIYA
jgi:group I intron endonuclease